MIVIKLKINFCFKFVWVMFITDIGFSSIQSTPAELVKNFPDSLKTNHSGEPLFIDILDFKNTDIKDVMRAIANKYKINIFVDDDIDVRVTVHMN